MPTFTPPKGYRSASPVLAVDDFFEGAAVGVLDGGERAVGRVPEGDQVGAVPVLREAEQLAGAVLVAHGGVTAADAEIGGRDHDAHRGLAEVVVHPGELLLGVLPRGDQRD